MSRHFANWDERTLDLAIDRFTVGLDGPDEARLDRLTREADLGDFEHALAAIHLASIAEVESPPAGLLDRLEREGRQLVAPGATGPAAAGGGTILRFPARFLALGGWLVAATLLVAFFLFRAGGPADPLERRDALVASAPDLVRADWSPTEDPAAAGASGDVVWSPSRQEGYMRFRSLEPNDPTERQYQLWIFDPTRADWEAKPVDGGVFDVAAGGEVVVPIDPKLEVRETALFAVTIEAPGGVVVSARERLVLTAAL